jgi:hypothetical protein
VEIKEKRRSNVKERSKKISKKRSGKKMPAKGSV